MPIPRGGDPAQGVAVPLRLLLYADGAIHPARSGVGVIVMDAQRRILQVANRTLPVMTNNEAEYAALSLALELAAPYQPEQIEIRMDSEVVIGQMIGQFSVNSPKLKVCHQQACALARALHRVEYRHIPREHNAVADALASEAASGRRWCSLEDKI